MADVVKALALIVDTAATESRSSSNENGCWEDPLHFSAPMIQPGPEWKTSETKLNYAWISKKKENKKKKDRKFNQSKLHQIGFRLVE